MPSGQQFGGCLNAGGVCVVSIIDDIEAMDCLRNGAAWLRNKLVEPGLNVCSRQPEFHGDRKCGRDIDSVVLTTDWNLEFLIVDLDHQLMIGNMNHLIANVRIRRLSKQDNAPPGSTRHTAHMAIVGIKKHGASGSDGFHQLTFGRANGIE